MISLQQHEYGFPGLCGNRRPRAPFSLCHFWLPRKIKMVNHHLNPLLRQ